MNTRRWAGAYFCLQGITVLVWWLVLFFYPPARNHFRMGEGSDAALLAFWLPDLALLSFGSLAAGVLCFTGSSFTAAAVWLTAGAASYATLYCLASAFLTEAGWLGVTFMLPAMLLSINSALAASPFVDKVFRHARPAAPAWILAKTGAQMLLFWGILLFLTPTLLSILETRIGVGQLRFPLQRPIAGVLFVGLGGLGIWSGYTMAMAGRGTPVPFDCARLLVVSGPYAYVRNPMAIAGLGQGLAVGLWWGSALVTGYVFVGVFIWQFLVRPLEEEDMVRNFGESYVEYRRNVRCWWPKRERYAGGAIVVEVSST